MRPLKGARNRAKARPTFSRASTAYLPDGTQVSSGAPRYVPGRGANLLKAASANFEGASTWVYDNGGNTTPPSYFGGVQSAVKRDGTQAAMLQITSSALATDTVRMYRYLQAPSPTGDAITLKVGAVYIASWWIWVTALAGTARTSAFIGNKASGTIISNTTTTIVTAPTSGWVRQWITFSPAVDTLNTYINIQLAANAIGGTGTAYIDQVQLEEASIKDSGGNWIPADWTPGGANLLTLNQSNGGEDGTTLGFIAAGGATLARTTSWSWQGTSSISVSGATSQSIVVEAYPVQLYTVSCAFSAYVYNPGTVTITVSMSLSGGGTVSTLVNPKQVVRIVSTFNSNSTSSGGQIRFWEATGQTFYVDGIQYEFGTVTTDWRPGANSGAILIEEGTTNLLSTADNNFALWTATDITQVTGQTDPAGGTTATKLVKGTATVNDPFYKYPGEQLAAGATKDYTGSIWLKADTTVTVNLVLYLQGVSSYQSTAITLNTGWQRYDWKVTMTNNLGTVANVGMGIRTPNASTIYVWHAQLEQKGYVTTWHPGSSGRLTDFLSIQPVPLTPAQGTIEMWVNVNNAVKRALTSIQATAFVLRNGTGLGPWIWAYWGGTGQLTLQVRKDDGTVTVSQALLATDTAIGWGHLAVAYTSSSVKLYWNGVPKLSAVGVNMPTVLDRLNLGCREGNNADTLGSYFDEIHISSIARPDAYIAAHAAKTSPIEPDAYTVALIHADGSLL
jgi:hypothetical protein